LISTMGSHLPLRDNYTGITITVWSDRH
jgi:hypothetical protein